MKERLLQEDVLNMQNLMKNIDSNLPHLQKQLKKDWVLRSD
jgi:hypothetical protein